LAEISERPQSKRLHTLYQITIDRLIIAHLTAEQARAALTEISFFKKERQIGEVLESMGASPASPAASVSCDSGASADRHRYHDLPVEINRFIDSYVPSLVYEVVHFQDAAARQNYVFPVAQSTSLHATLLHALQQSITLIDDSSAAYRCTATKSELETLERHVQQNYNYHVNLWFRGRQERHEHNCEGPKRSLILLRSRVWLSQTGTLEERFQTGEQNRQFFMSGAAWRGWTRSRTVRMILDKMGQKALNWGPGDDAEASSSDEAVV
jgi:hypothetical protein